MSPRRAGVTLFEVIVAAVIVLLVVGGTMMAFLTASQISRRGSTTNTEAAFYAQQTMERLRNKVACRQGGERQDEAWNGPTCNPDPPLGWQTDLLPPVTPAIPGSITNPAYSASRQFRVEPWDCDGNGTPDDCYRVTTKVEWTPPGS